MKDDSLLAEMIDEFGEERILDTPISEAAMVGTAVGAAATGLRPICEIMFMDFITLIMDQLLNHATKYPLIYGNQAKVPLIIRVPSGGWRAYGATHSQSLEAWLLHIPGLIVATPSKPSDAYGLMTYALQSDKTVVFVEHKLLYNVRSVMKKNVVPFGKAEVRRFGKDITLVAYSFLITKALEIAEELSIKGIDIEVIDPRTLVPLDITTLCESAAKTGRVLLVEEGTKTGGVCAEIAFQIQEKTFFKLKKSIIRVAAEDSAIPCAPDLESKILPSKEKIIEAVYQLIS